MTVGNTYNTEIPENSTLISEYYMKKQTEYLKKLKEIEEENTRK